MSDSEQRPRAGRFAGRRGARSSGHEPPRAAPHATSARAVAIRVLERVAERGAFASRALDAELARARLQVRDAALATEIVYGALRVLPDLDARIAVYLKRPLPALDPLLRAALRAGSYQLAYLSRVPAHAVVDETVGIVSAARGRALAGVANAVLRRLSEAPPAEPAARGVLRLPAWLERALHDSLGEERVRTLLEAGGSPPIALRARSPEAREALARELEVERGASGIEVVPARLSPLALLAKRTGDPRALPGYAEGRFSVQEEGAQLVALCLGAREGERVADLCAGHGGKTALLADAVGPSGEVTAVDVDERKLERIPAELARLQLPRERVVLRAIDLRVGTGGLGPVFDRVLVDAPCTGLGTLRRRPELLLRVNESDPARIAADQLAILTRAAALVRPGGRLLYAVCSPLPEEGATVGRAFEKAHAGARRVLDFGSAISPSLLCDPDGVLRLGPWLSGPAADSPDAYQLMAWEIPGEPTNSASTRTRLDTPASHS